MVMESLDAQPGPADRSHASPAPPGDTRVPTTSGHGVAISRSGDPGLESACRPSTRSNPSASPPGFGLPQKPGGLIGVPAPVPVEARHWDRRPRVLPAS
jgi:hypothetical protein